MSEVSKRRFNGIYQLYGEDTLRSLEQSHSVIVGVGGVGSWVAEALARTAIGELTLIDMDHVSESNINRQILALEPTIGMAKIEVLRQRIAQINPACRINLIDDFIKPDRLSKLVPPNADAVVDCIDSFRDKAALIAWCKRQKQFIVTVGGTGGRTDPSKIKLVDLSRTQNDPLLSRVRKELRQKYQFSRNPKRYFSIPAVCSTETPVRPVNCEESSLNCGGFGSVVHITATAGFFAVSRVIKQLLSDKLDKNQTQSLG